MGARREKFDADTRALLGCVAQVNHAAFLFLFGAGIDENEVRAELKFVLQINESAVRVDDDRVAVLAKFAPVIGSSLRADGNAGKHPGTTALRACLRF